MKTIASKRPVTPFDESRKQFTIFGAKLGSKIDSISYLLDEAISYTTNTLNNHFPSLANYPIDLRRNCAYSTLPSISDLDSDSDIASKLRVSLAILINRTTMIGSISNFFTSIYTAPKTVFDSISDGHLDHARTLCASDDFTSYAASSALKLAQFDQDCSAALSTASSDLADLFSTLLEINQRRQKTKSSAQFFDLAS